MIFSKLSNYIISKRIEDELQAMEVKMKASERPNSTLMMIHFHQEFAQFQTKIEAVIGMFLMFWKEVIEENPGIWLTRFQFFECARI